MLTLKGISKSFNSNKKNTVVLKGINLTIEKNDFVSITGRSGSGKSTLLNVAGTLLKPDEGDIFFNNIKIDFEDKKMIESLRRKDFAFIFQLHHLIPYLTALENILLPFSNSFKTISKELVEKGKELLDWVGLENKYHRLPGELSGGEQQRVAIARGIIKDPLVIFADEPTGSLDKKTSYNIIDLMMKIHSKGVSIILVTHELEFARLGSKSFLMEDGKIVN